MDLEGKRILISGVDAAGGDALRVAALAGDLGAEAVLMEADAGPPADGAERFGAIDGALHVIAPPAEEVHRRPSPAGDMRRAERDFLSTAYSLSALARAVLPLMRSSSERRPGIVGLSRTPAAPRDGRGSTNAASAALEAVNRYLACDLGPRGIRVNLVTATARTTPADSGSAPVEERAVRAARAACFLLSDWARAVTGEVLRVD